MIAPAFVLQIKQLPAAAFASAVGMWATRLRCPSIKLRRLALMLLLTIPKAIAPRAKRLVTLSRTCFFQP
jgi:hypothetical protein